jgi:hypothetical protein
MKKIETIYHANEAAETTMDAAADMGKSVRLFSPLSFLQVTLPILWIRGPGQMVMVTSEL